MSRSQRYLSYTHYIYCIFAIYRLYNTNIHYCEQRWLWECGGNTLMTTNSHLPNRQSNRLPQYDYQRPGYYYLTICTQDRHHAFGEIIDAHMHLSQEGQINQQ